MATVRSVAGYVRRRLTEGGLGTGDDRPTGFSQPGQPLPPGRVGDLIRTAPSPPPPDAPPGTSALRILYRSTDDAGAPIAVSGLAYVPPGSPLAGGRVVATYGHGSVGIASGCAPSRFPIHPDLVSDLLRTQMIVVATDYEGMGAPGTYRYLGGAPAGRSVLDAARAARAIPGAHASERVVIYGSSAGGHAALWSAGMTGAAADLDVRATVAIAPVGELRATMRRYSSHLVHSQYVLMLGWSWRGWRPDLRMEDVFPSSAFAWLPRLEDRCPGVPYRKILPPTLAERVLPDWFQHPAWNAALAANSPGRHRIEHPVLLVQGSRDEAIVAESTDELQQILISAGSVVTRLDVNADHGGVAGRAASDVVAWVSETCA